MRARPSNGTVSVAGIRIADVTFDDLTEDLRSSVDVVIPAQRQPRVYLAAHVGSLNHASDPQFRSAMNRSWITYADGISIVLLARLAGARRLSRMGTTDVGMPMIEAVRDGLGRRPRVAIVGGPEGLAERAGAVLATRTDVEIVYATHGYHEKYDHVLTAIELAAPDVLVVAMGMPHEANWIDANLDRLLVPVIFSCGGWLGFLVGDERRAPRLAQRTGFEWVWRLAQDPGRLGPRYVRGTVVCATAVVQIMGSRMRRGSGRR